MTCVFPKLFVISVMMLVPSYSVTVDDCVEYIPGNFNMIITAPHGGYLAVPNCPLRTNGCWINSQCYYDSSSTCVRDPLRCDYSFARDSNTQEIARMVAQNVATLLKKTPHLVIMKCTRETLDVNREINEAAQQCPNAQTAYNNYHNKIRSIIGGFTQGKGLLLDIHGQSHGQNSTELGYAISEKSIYSAVADPNHNFPTGSLTGCSIRSLLARLTAGGLNTNWDVLAGKKSMGMLLEKEGFAALPGPTYPLPGVTNYEYFDGGYTIRKKAYLVARKGRLNYKQIQGLAKQLDWTERQVERWIRMRRMMDRPSTLVKFMECGWRFSYYGFVFAYGVWTLWDKDWLWDINNCWYTFPHQGVTNDIWWYYMIELSFYWSLLFSMFEDIKRKDFWEMLIHHFVTIILLVLSWTCNLVRAGTLVLVIHDCADIFLEMAKMMKYIKWQKTCDVLFGIFTVTWICSRLVVYPFWFLYSTCIGAKEIVPMFPAYYIFNSLLLLLLLLHVIWTYFILKVLYRAILSGQMEKDSRSSSSEDFSEDNSKSGNSSASPTTPSKRLPASSISQQSREHKNSK